MTRVGSALPVEQKREVGCGRVVGTSRGGAGKWSYCCGRMGSGRSHWGFGCGAKGDRRIVALLHRSQDLSRQHSALYGCYTNNSQARGYGVHQSRDACEQKYDQFGRSVDRIVVASGSIRKSMLPAATLDERTIVLFITQVLGLRCLRDIRAFDRSNDKK